MLRKHPALFGAAIAAVGVGLCVFGMIQFGTVVTIIGAVFVLNS